MRCANPKCLQDAQDLQNGTLWRLEMEVAPEERVVRGESGFPVCAVPSKYFWLCVECSRTLTIRRWTPAGLILEPKLRGGSQEESIHSVKMPPPKETLRSRRRVPFNRVA